MTRLARQEFPALPRLQQKTYRTLAGSRPSGGTALSDLPLRPLNHPPCVLQNRNAKAVWGTGTPNEPERRERFHSQCEAAFGPLPPNPFSWQYS